MNHMFTISDNESENSDDAAEADQSKGKPGDKVTLPDITLSAPAHDRLRVRSDSHASTGGQAEDGDLPGGAVFDEGGGAEETPPIRGRSQSAPPQLWAAMRYGRQLRRMSDEFDILMDKGEMKKLQKAAATKWMRPSLSWFAFWRRRDSDTDVNSNGSGTDRSAD